jgi:hypothetical protein
MPPYGQPPGGAPAPPAWGPVPPPPRRSKGLIAAVAIAIMLAIAALVVGVVDLVRPSTPATPAASTPTSPAPTSSPADFTAADRALCTAIAPLMTDSNRVAKAFTSLGPGGSPESNAGVPKFISDTKDWVGRIQPVIDSHPDADPFFRRTLQRFVDDRRLLVADLEAGPWTPYDQTNWNDSLSLE